MVTTTKERNDFIMSPKVDYAFKELMQNEKVREQFLEDILNVKDIENTTLVNTVLRKEHGEDKYGILDVRVKLVDQTEIDIEIQVAALPIWADRSLYYVSKMFTETIKSSEEYDVLKKCIGISVLDFNLWEDNSFYHTCFKIMETKRHFLYSDKMEFHVIELKKVSKTAVDDNDAAYWWGCFINAKRKEEFEMLAQKNPNLEVAYEQLQHISADEIKRAEYQRREKEIRDKLTYLKFAKMEGLEEGRQEGLEKGMQEGLEKGMQKGLEKGMQKGLEKGMQKGLEKGRQEGREKEREEMAIKLLKKGFPPEDIVEVSYLSIDRIMELKAQLKE